MTTPPAEVRRALDAHAEWVRSAGATGRQLDQVALDLGDADLRGALLHDCVLPEARLSGADLREADLSAAFLNGSDLRDANLSGVNLRKAELDSCSMTGTDLSDANLRRATLFGSDLRGANLTRAVLRKTQFDGTDLRGANLQGAHLHDTFFVNGTRLGNAGLRGARVVSFHVDWIDIAEGEGSLRLETTEAEGWIRERIGL